MGRFEIIIWLRTSSVGLGGAWDNASSSGSGLKISVCLPPGGSRTRRDGTIVSRSEAGMHGVLCESETVALNSETYQKLLPARQWQRRRSVCQISRILSAKVLTSASSQAICPLTREFRYVREVWIHRSSGISVAFLRIYAHLKRVPK
jgi:hypothetical protein